MKVYPRVYLVCIDQKSRENRRPKHQYTWIYSFSPNFHFRNALNDPSGATYFLWRMSTLERILCMLIRNRPKIEGASNSTHGFSHFNPFSNKNALNDPSGVTYFRWRMSTLACILCVLIRNREKIEGASMSTHGFSHFYRIFSKKCTQWPQKWPTFFKIYSFAYV
jgi:hypothetical protein